MPILKQQDHYRDTIEKSVLAHTFNLINHKIMNHV